MQNTTDENIDPLIERLNVAYIQFAPKMKRRTDHDVKDGTMAKLALFKKHFGFGIHSDMQPSPPYFPADSVKDLFESIAGKFDIFKPNAHTHLAKVFDEVEYLYDYENRNYPIFCRLQDLVFVCFRDRIELYSVALIDRLFIPKEFILRATLHKLLKQKAFGALPADLAKLIYKSYTDGNSLRGWCNTNIPNGITCIEVTGEDRYQYVENEEVAYYALGERNIHRIKHVKLELFFAYADIPSIQQLLKRYFKNTYSFHIDPFFDEQDVWNTLKKLNQCGCILSEIHVIDQQLSSKSLIKALRLSITCIDNRFLPVDQPNEVKMTVYSPTGAQPRLLPIPPRKYPDISQIGQDLSNDDMRSLVINAVISKQPTIVLPDSFYD